MDILIVVIFCAVYFGMVLGEIPGLALDRTGIALLGAIAFLVSGHITPENALHAIDVPTMGLLFGLMVLSAQFRLGGFYARTTLALSKVPVSAAGLLALLIAVSAFLSALLANDIICLAMTPVLIEGCIHRHLNPVPFLIGLACSANIGSAATLIGNPQNMLIGQKLGLPFTGYFFEAIIPVILGLLSTWWIISWIYRNRWDAINAPVDAHAPLFNPWQTSKAIVILSGVVILFLGTGWPREIIALAGAGILLTSRHMTTRSILGLVDWNLLTLFAGLFIVNAVVEQSGLLNTIFTGLKQTGIDIHQPAWLFLVSAGLSNLVSNVPATMLLLPTITHPMGGTLLALSSTLAGNFIIVGSIANIIVVDQAKMMNIPISWREHARVGIPVTVVSMLLASVWLCLLSIFSGS